MNKIIAIYGKSNSGKTSTIVEIDKLLIKKYKFDVKVIDKI
jgi:molybdopterin-guanine dinucleotide biosynthesis protein